MIRRVVDPPVDIELTGLHLARFRPTMVTRLPYSSCSMLEKLNWVMVVGAKGLEPLTPWV